MVHDIPTLIQYHGGNVKFIQSLDDHFNDGHNDHTNEVRFLTHASIILLPSFLLFYYARSSLTGIHWFDDVDIDHNNDSRRIIFLTCIPLLEPPINLKKR